MNKKELDLLGKVFQAEIDSALNNGIGLHQTKSKLAKKLESDGLINEVTAELGKKPLVAKVTGYELTEAGRYRYCYHCADEVGRQPV